MAHHLLDRRCHAVAALIGVMTLASSSAVAGAAADVRLEYRGHYNSQKTYIDHLVGVECVLDHHAIVCSNDGLVLLDLEALPEGGTFDFVNRLRGIQAFTTVTRDDGYIYVSLKRDGLHIAHLYAASLTFTEVGALAETGVFYDKVTVDGDRLFIPAHGAGLRIHDISSPAHPMLLGRITSGLDDAFAIATSGDTVYVADGAGGLKIIDAADPRHPRIVAGETVETAVGTSEDVLVVGPHVYVAAGSAGVVFYPFGDLTQRIVYDTPGAAKQLVRIGDRIAVADIGGLQVFSIEPDGSLTLAARESGSRRFYLGTERFIRLWHGVSAWGDDRLVTAEWDWIDVFELVPAATARADITPSTQRVHIDPDVGSVTVHVRNDGGRPLDITNAWCTESTFSIAPTHATIAPGAGLDLVISWSGVLPGSALAMIESNDPDESPLPIQVFARTGYLDIGEPAVPFTCESWTYDHETDTFAYHEFDLARHTGQLVYLHMFSSW